MMIFRLREGVDYGLYSFRKRKSWQYNAFWTCAFRLILNLVLSAIAAFYRKWNLFWNDVTIMWICQPPPPPKKNGVTEHSHFVDFIKLLASLMRNNFPIRPLGYIALYFFFKIWWYDALSVTPLSPIKAVSCFICCRRRVLLVIG